MRKPFITSGIALIAALNSYAVVAQDQASDQQDTDEILFEEIIVTAQKRAQTIQDVPLSVTALDENSLEDIGAVGFIDYAATIPGLNFANRGSGRARISIRGVSPVAGQVSTTGIYLDGVGLSSLGNNPDFKLFDVERVEILRGPQGTLYGEGSLGGTIKIITNKPNSEKYEIKADSLIDTVAGGGESYSLSSVVNVPIVKGKAAIRLSGFYRDVSGFIDNVVSGKKDINGEEAWGIRAAGKFDLTENLSVELIYNHQDVEIGALNVRTPGLGRYEVARAVDEFETDVDDQYTALVTWDVGFGTIESITGFNRRDDDRRLDGTSVVGIASEGIFTSDVETFNEELRFVSEFDGPFSFVAGLFYRDRELSNTLTFPGLGVLFGVPGDFANVLNTDTKTKAVFGEATYAFSESLRLTAGLRWFDEDIDNQGSTSVGPIVLESRDEDASFNAVTPKFNIAYDVSDDWMLYATAAKGFRSGGTNVIGGPDTPSSFEPDTAWSFEIGSKAALYDGRLIINTAAYYFDWNNLIIRGVPENPALGFNTNAGSAHSAGFEIETILRPMTGLDLTLSAGYIEAELDAPAQGAEEGARLPNVPKYSLAGAIQYERPISDNLTGTVRADFQLQGSTNNSLPAIPVTEIPAYGLANFRVGVASERWEISLFAKNIFNSEAITFIGASSGEALGRPRTIGMNIRFQY